MVHIGLLFFLGGAAGAVWRGHRKKAARQLSSLPVVANTVPSDGENTVSSVHFDDVGELRHYQKVSWYALTFTSAGWLFFPPVSMVAAPLLGYNSCNFLQALMHSSNTQRKSALTLFELMGVSATLLTGKPMATSLMMLFAFIRRNMLLQAGNISNNLSPDMALQYQRHQYWILREGVEIEVLGSQLQESDIIVLTAGQTIILEGTVVFGEGQVRQFGLNKKMKTLSKSVGDKVYPFTYLQSGLIHFKQKIK